MVSTTTERTRVITKKKSLEMTTKEKLLELARFLVEEVEAEWFNLGSWASNGFLQKKCGTTACAGGWATVCFPKSGLKLKRGITRSELLLVHKGHNGFGAVTAFFGISRDEAEYLFNPDEYVAPHNKRRNVAKRLREVAKKY